MSPNRFAVALTIGALLLPAIAQAQGQLDDNDSDLIVQDVDIGTRRVVGIAAPINVTIRNIGTDVFTAPSGWTVFVGLNGGEHNDCIETNTETGSSSPSPAAPTPTSPCYKRYGAGDLGSNTIQPGGTVQFSIVWNASESDATDETLGSRIWVEILQSTDATARESMEGCSGPDTKCENNIHTEEIFIGMAGVRARPDRDITGSVAGAKVNTAWSTEEAEANTCPAPPEPVRKACTAMPGSTILALFSVTNTGTIHDAFVPTIVDQLNLQGRGYIFGVAPRSLDLDPRQTKEAKVTITIPEDEAADTAFNLDPARTRVNWRSTLNPRVSTADTDPCPTQWGDDGLCENPSLPTFVVGTRRSANVTANDTWMQLARGTSGTFKVNLNNTGNANDRYTIRVDNQTWSISDAWKVNFTPPGLIAPRANDNATVGFYVPPDTLNGTYGFDIVIESRFDTGEIVCVANGQRSPGQCRVHFTIHVQQDWALSSSSDIPARVLPGGRATYNLAVRNLGNGWDNVTLDMQSSVSNWNPQLSNTTLRLPPGAALPFTLTATPPPNTAAGAEGFFYINATASGPREGGAERVKAEMIVSQLTVRAGSNIGLSTPLNSSFVDLGRSVDFEVNLQNTGNRPDNFTIAASPGNPNWGVTVAPAYASLAPLESATIRLTLRAPTFADVGEKTSVLVDIGSTADPGGLSGQIALEGRVSGPDIYLDTLLLSPASPYSGDEVTVSVGLGNKGNKVSDRNVTVRLFFVQEGIELLIGNKTYLPTDIPAQRRLTEQFTWDTEGIEGTGVIIARVDMNEAKEIDDSPESNERSVPVTLRTFDIRVVAAEGRTARPGEAVTYSDPPHAFLVEYRGNQLNEPVTIQFESEHGWLTSPAEVPYNLPRGTPIPVVAKLEIPQKPGASKDRLSIRVIPALRADAPLTASTVTSILDEENPKVFGILATPATATIGDEVTIDVLVDDATGISSARAFITSPTNETTAVPLARKSADTWTLTQTFSVAGRHRVTVEVTDSADPPNVNKTRDTIGEFVVSPGSAPVIRLAQNQSTTIRTGALVRLDITDPLGVARASYTIMGVTYDMRAPNWQIDTSTFQAGDVTVNVTAENIYGVTSSATFKLRVDNDLPVISKVTLSPQAPKANEDVTVTIATDAKVQAVDVLVKRNGQVVETINATKKSAGTFQFKFNPGEGDYSLDVTARNEAGNSKLAPGIVTFSAKPGSPFEVPGPALWVVLAAVAVAMLVRRRAA